MVLIVSVLAAAAVPAFTRLQRRAKTTTIVNDFRTFAAAFETYTHEKGGWPAETAAGVCPPVMTSRVNTAAWGRTTPMGGKYNWDYRQNHFGTTITAAISIAAVTGAPLPLDVAQLTDLENVLDAGNTNWLGGNFRLGTGIIPVYVIQP